MDERVTFLVPTSPIRLHPDPTLLIECLESIVYRYPDANVIVLADGVRPEQEHYREAYEAYLDSFKYFEIHGITMYKSEEWVHQANMVRIGLELVTTPVVGYVEHDCLLTGDVEDRVFDAITDGYANLIRLAPWESPPDYWAEHFGEARDIDGVSLMPVTQWSTWPHFAGTDFMRRVMQKYFDVSCRTMIEPVMHSVLANTEWRRWRVWMYAPEGDMTRCVHRYEARGDDPVYDFEYAYPNGETPEGAPEPWKNLA